MDVPNEGPAIVLREMLPGRHGASPIADLPEELTVRLVLDLLRRPIGRLRAERSRGHAITLAFRAVARDAVDLGDLLALIHDLRISWQGIPLRLLRRRRLPGRLGIRDAGQGEHAEDQHPRRSPQSPRHPVASPSMAP